MNYEKRLERQDPWTRSRGFDSGFSLVEQLLVDGQNLSSELRVVHEYALDSVKDPLC